MAFITAYSEAPSWRVAQYVQLASPLLPFAKPLPQPIPVGPASRGQNSFDVIAQATGCSTASDKIACLRALTTSQLTAATNLLPNILSYHSVSLAFLPRTDGVFLTDLAQNLMAEGKYAKDVSLLSGDQYDEGELAPLFYPESINAEEIV
jgi:hypothetical protein